MIAGLVPHHIGFAVADLADAMDRVGSSLRLRWREPVHGGLDRFRARGVAVQWQLSHVKSTGDSGLVVELLQGGPGSTWYVPEGIAFHHWAYAPADRAAGYADLLRSGWTIDVSRDVDDLADSTFAYFTRQGQPRIEVCCP